MIESIDTSLIDWSRAQFAMTAMYHWIFVPLTLGLAVVMGICLLYTSPSPRDSTSSRMPSSA